MAVSAETMREILEREGTPPKYRSRYLWLGENLMGWRFCHELGSWDMGQRFLPENYALRMLRSYEGMQEVITRMYNLGWLMMLTTFQGPKDSTLCYQVQFVDLVGEGGIALAEKMVDAVLLAAWRAHRRMLSKEGE